MLTCGKALNRNSFSNLANFDLLFNREKPWILRMGSFFCVGEGQVLDFLLIVTIKFERNTSELPTQILTLILLLWDRWLILRWFLDIIITAFANYVSEDSQFLSEKLISRYMRRYIPRKLRINTADLQKVTTFVRSYRLFHLLIFIFILFLNY